MANRHTIHGMSGDRWTGALPVLLAVALASALLAGCGGGSSNATDQFRGKTDSALVAFGEEGSTAEREQATETVSTYLAARSKGDWETACEQVAEPMVDKLEHLAVTSTSLHDKSCASFLEAYVQLSPEEQSEKSAEDGALRHSGQRGFLIYLGANEVVCAMPLEEDGGEWKVAAVTAKRLS